MRRPRIAQVDLAAEAVEGLQPLDRVALHRRPDALANGSEQVDEDAAAQQAIDLLLARRVAAHQPRGRGRLVGGVVVDVEARIAGQAVHDQVDGLLEGPLLGLAGDPTARVAGPDLVVGRGGLVRLAIALVMGSVRSPGGPGSTIPKR